MPEELKTRYPKREKSSEQALASLMRLCARSEKSSGDALRLMRGWGVDPTARAGVLEELIRTKFIDDSRYAGAFVREKINLSGWGEYKIRAALKLKGIDRELIDRAMAGLDRDSMRGRLERQLASRVRRTTGMPYQVKGKLMRYGLSLGYNYELVAEVVERIIKEEE